MRNTEQVFICFSFRREHTAVLDVRLVEHSNVSPLGDCFYLFGIGVFLN